jgi:clan AA aspartic protease
MISGTIAHRRAYVVLPVRDASAEEVEIEFVLDTGFTGSLTIPPEACSALALPFLRLQPAHLADRSRIMLDVYEADLLWDGVERTVEVLAMDGAPLIGMALLTGFDVRLQVAEGGLVTIEPL